ncbi:MAG: DUF551 domain-containing protein [Acidobacteria bacterium]|nr:DUF551 domain-containing protein [Acidobacteriota bacterium]
MSENDDEYPDEYLDENGNEYPKEEPEQERGELKPCPFCGSKNTTLDYFEISCPQELGTLVLCGDCGSYSTSVDRWNTRPIEDALNKRIAELEAERRWIPVSERLPKEKQSVLALDRTGTAYHWEYSRSLSNIFVGYYTHWMPLPEPPEVKE